MKTVFKIKQLLERPESERETNLVEFDLKYLPDSICLVAIINRHSQQPILKFAPGKPVHRFGSLPLQLGLPLDFMGRVEIEIVG